MGDGGGRGVLHREGTGLLEYEAMPSLCDVACDGVLCTFCNRSASDWYKWCVVRQGRRHGLSITYKITPDWVTLLQPRRRAVGLGQPSSLRHHWGALPSKRGVSFKPESKRIVEN